MGKVRTNRIAEEIKRELSQIIRSELKDPRVSGIVSITGVEVSGDLKIRKGFCKPLRGKRTTKRSYPRFGKGNRVFKK